MAQPDNTDGSMIALYPPPELAKTLAVDTGLPPGELHVTVAYTGHAADTDRKKLRKAAKNLAGRPPVAGTISGHARFTGGDKDVIVALVDSPALEKLRGDTLGELGDQDVDVPSDHGFTAHMTLAYVGKDDPDPVVRLPARPVTFDGVSAVHGKTRKTHAFDTTLAEHAREAFAAGWALSGAQVTGQLPAEADAAVWVVLTQADDPRILEATLQIGKLRGTWAEFFRRRQSLEDQHKANVAKAWAVIGAGIHPGRVIDSLRAELGQPTKEQAPYVAQVAGSAAAGLLAGAYAHTSHGDLLAAVEDAVQAAMAEGKAGVLALNAEQHGVADGFSFDAAYQAIYDQLASLPEVALMGQQWVQRIIAGAAGDVGRILARLFAEGASRQEMVDAIMQALTAADGAALRAVNAFVSQAMATAMSQASLDLYASEGTEQVDFVTAGDAAVCVLCQGYQDGNPYTPYTCPTPGSDTHPFCRCVVMPHDPGVFRALAALIAGT